MKVRALVTVLALLGGLVAFAAAPAQAMETALSATASPIWQTNNSVRAIAYANGKIFVGGEFTSVRPPGAAAGTQEVSRTYLAAFDSTTGALITTFNPVLNGIVWALATSPDGSKVYVGGDFTTINSTGRGRVAAFNASTGALDGNFKPYVAWRVANIATSGNSVYLGGSFGAINNIARNHAGAVAGDTGNLLPWDPNVTSDPSAPIKTSPDVQAMAVSQDGTKVYLGGRFTTVGGVPNYAFAGVDAISGVPFPVPGQSAVPKPTTGCVSGVSDIVVDANTAYVAAVGDGGGCFDGTFAVTIQSGALKWKNTCLGATEALMLIKGWLYKGSHAHDCSSGGDFGQGPPRFLLVENPSDGSLGAWYPNTNAGGATQVGPLAFGTDGNQLFVGGDFTTVNNQGQRGLTRFGPSPDTAPIRPLTPSAASPLRGTVKVNFKATTDLDDENLTYRLFRNTSPTPLQTYRIKSRFWDIPSVSYVDTGLTPGTQVAYRVEVTDGTNTLQSFWTPYVTVAASTAPYPTVIQSDGAVNYWRLGESSGTAAVDSGTTTNTGTYVNPTLGRPGVLADNTAVDFNGTSSRVNTANLMVGPQTFTIEAWIKTRTGSGGKIIGFGNSRTGTSGNYDRHLYMSNDGHVVMGVYNGSVNTVRSQAALNDGNWHLVAGTMRPGAMTLYVDGESQGTTPASSAEGFSGYWKIGGDNLNSWPYQPSSSSFAGTIDEVAVYPTALNPTDLAVHFTAGGGNLPAVPVAVDDSASTAFQTPLVVSGPGVLSNDTGTGITVSSNTSPAHGAVSLSSNGAYTYTPAAGFSGVDSFTYTVTDIANQTATATVSITVSAPGVPVAVDDSASTAFETPLVVSGPGVLSNDTGTGITVSSNTSPAHGAVSMSSNGAYTYTPAAGFSGVDSFTYTVTDIANQTATATVSVTVTSPSVPVAVDDSASTAFQTAKVVPAPGVLGNDVGSGLSVTANTSPAHGIVSIGADGGYTYTPDAGFAGSDAFTYTVSDVLARTSTASVSLTVVAPAGPVAHNDSGATAFQTPFVLPAPGVLANDSGTQISVTGHSAASHGSVALASDGALTYTPADGWAGPDGFTYTITDVLDRTATATVTVTVAPAPSLVLAQDDFTRTVSGGWGTGSSGSVWGPNNSDLSVNGQRGVVTVAAGNTRVAYLTGLGAVRDVDATTQVQIDKLPGGTGVFSSLILRRASTGIRTEYRGSLRVQSSGKVSALIYRLVSGSPDVIVGNEQVITGVTAAPGQDLSMRLVATGANPTQLSLTVWKTDTPEPAAQVTTTDSAAGLQTAGLVGVTTLLSATSAATPINVSFDNFVARKPA